MSKLDFKQKVLVIFFLSLPFLDLLTSLSTRFIDSPITIGIVVKGLSLLVSLVYVLFYSKNKYRKHTILYLIGIGIFAGLYFVTKPDIWQISSLITEVIQAFKFLYFPIMLLCLYVVFHDFAIEPKIIRTIVSFDCMVYALLIIVPFITGTDFPSYDWAFSGTTGWFYAANEVGAILVILSVCLLYFMDNQKKWKILLAIPIIYSISLMGTKVGFIGIIAIVLMVSLVYILRTKENPYLLPGILLVILIVASINSAAIRNMDELAGMDTLPSTEQVPSTEEVVPDTEFVDPDANSDMVVVIRGNKLLTLINRVTSKRLLYFMENYRYYSGNGAMTMLFGLGWAPRTAIHYPYYRPLIEIDILDIWLHYGIMGLLVYFAPFVFLAYKLIHYIKKVSFASYAYIFSVILGFGISCIAGHVLGAPSVSILMTLLILFVVRQVELKQK